MISTDLIPTVLLERKAVVYVRQSTQSQVTNLESQRRQYDLVDVARQRGFLDVEVIDDDLGRSASGTVRAPRLRSSRRPAVRRQSWCRFMLRCLTART